ncbi:hypothetical protein CAEBREN_14042 [Caenorhabditis brenneri]|uniref:Uncharacterized protein n=1 Tax=Caenorhabditis brenneri TaxID=135651 RepID=G0NP38_CAEBE|nr:hypothetical protein CAEBREN_14042 [Caenorhabditis brenneri]
MGSCSWGKIEGEPCVKKKGLCRRHAQEEGLYMEGCGEPGGRRGEGKPSREWKFGCVAR